MDDKNLIFLISQPRAGSTLLQLMLSGHPEISTTSEPWIALHPIYALRESGIQTSYDFGLSQYALRDFLKQTGVDDDFYKKQIAPFLFSFYKHAMDQQKKGYFLDKTPRYYNIIPELVEIFPKAKFIILFRNPAAVLNSILKTWIKDDLLDLQIYYEDLIEAPGRLVDGVNEHPENCHKITFEELVVDPDKVLEGICSFVGIPYHDDMPEYGGKRSSAWNFGDPVGVHKEARPNASLSESWKMGFKSKEHRVLANSYIETLGPKLVEKMGYNYNDIVAAIEAPAETKGLITWQRIEKEWKEHKATGTNPSYSALRIERDQAINSLSWKMTAPLRSIGKLFKR